MVDATSNNPPVKAAYIRLGVKNQFSIDKSLWTCFTEELYEYTFFSSALNTTIHLSSSTRQRYPDLLSQITRYPSYCVVSSNEAICPCEKVWGIVLWRNYEEYLFPYT